MANLADEPEHQALAAKLSARLFEILEETNGRAIPLYPDFAMRFRLRMAVPAAEQAAPFPPVLIKKPEDRPYN